MRFTTFTVQIPVNVHLCIRVFWDITFEGSRERKMCKLLPVCIAMAASGRLAQCSCVLPWACEQEDHNMLWQWSKLFSEHRWNLNVHTFSGQGTVSTESTRLTNFFQSIIIVEDCISKQLVVLALDRYADVHWIFCPACADSVRCLQTAGCHEEWVKKVFQ